MLGRQIFFKNHFSPLRYHTIRKPCQLPSTWLGFSQVLYNNFSTQVSKQTIGSLTTFKNVGTPSHVLGKLAKLGYNTPTAIQSAALPKILSDEKSDFVVHSSTGTGKTLTYLIPILSRLEHTPSALAEKKLRALILVPTRELAVQIQKIVEQLSTPGQKKQKLGEDTKPSIRVRRITGEISRIKLNSLKSDPPHILIGTPRSMKSIIPTHVGVGDLYYFVADEIDHLVMPFSKDDVYSIMKHINTVKYRPRMIFVGATSSVLTRKAIEKFQRRSCLIDLTTDAPIIPSSISHLHLHCVSDVQKRNMIPRMLAAFKPSGMLIFTKDRTAATELENWLSTEKRIPSVTLVNDGRSNRLRARALQKLERGTVRVMIATEMAARGLDISNLSHVINFDVPVDPRSYIHRAGRVGRFGSVPGVVITLTTDKDEVKCLNDFSRRLGFSLQKTKLVSGTVETI